MAPLYQQLITDSRFHQLLMAFDRDIAASCRATGCLVCGGALHSAQFPRKPRGLPAGLGDDFNFRFSFCCSLEECRKRATPSSMRFLGRKVYIAAVLTLISAMVNGATAARRQLSDLLGVSRRTVQRWQGWWLSTFTAGSFWKLASAAFTPPVDAARIPASLLDRFVGAAEERLLALLRFLAPITGGASSMRAF